MEEKIFEVIATTIANLILSDGLSSLFDSIKNKIKDKNDKRMFIDQLSSYLSKEQKYNGLDSLANEYDFEGICKYLCNGSVDKIEIAISGTESERKAARNGLYNSAFYNASANTKESQDIVRKMVSNVIDILRRIAKGKITFEDKVLAVEIEDAINQHTDLVADKVIENNKKVIDSYADKFAKEVEKSSYYSSDTFSKLANDGNYEEKSKKESFY